MKIFYKQQSIQFKLIAYFVTIAIVMLVVGILSFFINSRNAEVVSSVMVDYVYLNDLDQDMNQFNKVVKSYLLNKSSESLLKYYEISDSIMLSNNKLPDRKSYNPIHILERNIFFLTEKYLNEADRAIEAKRGRNTDNYRLHYEQMQKIAGFISINIDELLSKKLNEGSAEYDSSKQTAYIANVFSLVFTASALLIGLALSTTMVFSITRPLIELTKNAEKVTNGDFEVDPIEIGTGDEVEILSHAFDEMLKFIRNHIDDIVLQSELENTLNEQRVQNLHMQSLLKEAELKSLQAQINPHFLYNTLNAATQLSMIEGAERTSEFIQKMSMYFRYMLRQINATVTVREELENVETYMYILKTRFGDRIHYETDIDDSLLEIHIPSTVIQPVVENAYMHGLEEMEGKGTILLKLYENQEQIYLEIADNGKGMTTTELQDIMNMEVKNSQDVHDSSGIGISNVIERLRLFYNKQLPSDVFEVESELAVGTVVRLKLYREGVKPHA